MTIDNTEFADLVLTRFDDGEGRKWSCAIDWAAMRRAAAAGVDLSAVEEQLGDFYRGSVKLIDAVWAVVQPQADAAGVTQSDFEATIRGDAIERATAALVAGLVAFFPCKRAELIHAANQEVKDQIKELTEQFTKPSTDSPENSE